MIVIIGFNKHRLGVIIKVKKVMSIVGARPQFIKAAVLSRLLKSIKYISEVIVHTGQHYDKNMSEVFFKQLEMPEPEYNLGVGSGDHGYQTGKMLEMIEKLLIKIKPDLVLVYGDTNSTLAGALAAVKLHIPVAHVEAGLRSHNRKMPEEINRVATDHISDLLFAPSEIAINNLRKEGLPEEKIKQVGDVMLDAALLYIEKAERESTVLDNLKLVKGNYILATVHRAENTNNKNNLKSILRGLEKVAEEMDVVLPLHPRTREALKRERILNIYRNMNLIEPLGYLDMAMLEKNAAIIVTDSGGVQKEAYFYRVPCVTLREETEWIELVDSGWNLIHPPHSSEDIYKAIISSLGKSGQDVKLYGDGHAADRIALSIRNYFN